MLSVREFSIFSVFILQNLNGKINVFNHLVTQQTVKPDVIQTNETQLLYFLTVPIHLQHYSRRSTVVSISSTFPLHDLPAKPAGPRVYFLPLEDNCMNSNLSPPLCKWNLCHSNFHLHIPPFLFWYKQVRKGFCSFLSWEYA